MCDMSCMRSLSRGALASNAALVEGTVNLLMPFQIGLRVAKIGAGIDLLHPRLSLPFLNLLRRLLIELRAMYCELARRVLSTFYLQNTMRVSTVSCGPHVRCHVDVWLLSSSSNGIVLSNYPEAHFRAGGRFCCSVLSKVVSTCT
jgi:hypothetical protein